MSLFKRLPGLLLAIGALLTACGGGSSPSAGALDSGNDQPPAQIASALTLSGTAATGRAIAGAPISVKCQTGSAVGTTGEDGSFQVVVSNGALPCLLQTTDPADGSILHGVAAGIGLNATANITPLTEMVTARTLGREPATFFIAFDSAETGRAVTSAAIRAAQSEVANVLVDAVNTAGLKDFVATPLKAATAANTAGGDAQDQLLDALRVTAWWQRGFALGVAAHGIGTSRAFSVNAEAGAYASLGMGLHGIAGAMLIPYAVAWWF